MSTIRIKLSLVAAVALAALVLLATLWANGSSPSEAQQGAMHNCPQPGKWAISVWSGDDSTDTAEALTTCGEGQVAAAYYVDPEKQSWLRYFVGRAEISNLTTLDEMQGVLAFGGATAAAGEVTSAGSVRAPQGAQQMHDCPQPGKWAISVWGGDDGTNTPQALATCGEGSVDFAYYIDPDTQQWLRYFLGRTEISNLPTLDNMQGVIAHGAAAAPPSTAPIAFVSDRDGNDEIYVMNADGTGQTRLSDDPTHGTAPVWSPSGAEIAFESDRDGNDEIYVMNTDGTGQTNLTDNSATDGVPTWSPDGAKIAFESDRDGNREIYVMNADGTGQTNLTSNPATDGVPAWSPDGSKITFFSYRDGNPEIYVMNADGTDQTRLTDNPALDRDPVWSPDGSQIAFWSFQSANWEIYVMNADGTGQTNLTNTPGWDGDYTWSPDGSQIAFVSERDDNLEIYVINADGTGQANITSNLADDDQPAWRQ